jgi:DNA repair protein RecO (recombination protein O)
MEYKTNGIVLRNVKYGETSLIVSIYTELFGIQSYLINGVRSSSKKGPGRANLFQPAAVLDLVVYHQELKNLQRIKEFRWGYLFKHLFFNITKNLVALFMVELLQKCLKQPEPNSDLFQFMEDALICLDESSESVVGNYPVFFMLHLIGFFGFPIQDEQSDKNSILDLQQGFFVSEQPMHPYFLDVKCSYAVSQLLKVRKPHELDQVKLNQETRRKLLDGFLQFYAMHIQDFGVMKTLPVLQTVL